MFRITERRVHEKLGQRVKARLTLHDECGVTRNQIASALDQRKVLDIDLLELGCPL